MRHDSEVGVKTTTVSYLMDIMIRSTKRKGPDLMSETLCSTTEYAGLTYGSLQGTIWRKLSPRLVQRLKGTVQHVDSNSSVVPWSTIVNNVL